MKLTDTDINTAKSTDKAYKLADGGGMYVHVMPNGSKYFRLDYRLKGKRLTLALGVYPSTSLDTARLSRDTAKKQIKDGIKPSVDTANVTVQDKDTTIKKLELQLSEQNRQLIDLQCKNSVYMAFNKLTKEQGEKLFAFERTESGEFSKLVALAALRVEKTISDFTDDELQGELELRGWEVTLHKTV